MKNILFSHPWKKYRGKQLAVLLEILIFQPCFAWSTLSPGWEESETLHLLSGASGVTPQYARQILQSWSSPKVEKASYHSENNPGEFKPNLHDPGREVANWAQAVTFLAIRSWFWANHSCIPLLYSILMCFGRFHLLMDVGPRERDIKGYILLELDLHITCRKHWNRGSTWWHTPLKLAIFSKESKGRDGWLSTGGRVGAQSAETTICVQSEIHSCSNLCKSLWMCRRHLLYELPQYAQSLNSGYSSMCDYHATTITLILHRGVHVVYVD